MTPLILDPESGSPAERFALIRDPRPNRGRFAEGCVTLMEDEATAMAGADPARHRRPALVHGPSLSSEGHRIYYLVRWLT